MQARQRVVVIGAGVIGLSIGWRLAAAGSEVVVVEATQPGAGTSRTSFAWANASSKIDYSGDYFALNQLALKEHHALADSLGARSWLHATGDIELASGDAAGVALEQKVQALLQRGYAAELLTAARLEELEPGTRFGNGQTAAFYAQEGWVDVDRLIAYLLAAGTAAGMTEQHGDPATEIILNGSRASGVKLASGRTIPADVVVTALGRWTAKFVVAQGVTTPLVDPEVADSKAIGLLATVSLASAPHRLLHSADVNWSPLEGRRALLASEAADAAVAMPDAAKRAASEARALIEQAAAINPLYHGASVERFDIGLRALPADGVSICGWTDGLEGLYVAVTHSGVTLAPLLGKLIAHEIADGVSEPILSGFRPQRFGARRAERVT